jgi:hypothetical protein
MYSRLYLNYLVNKARIPPINKKIIATQASQTAKKGHSAKMAPSIIASPIIAPALICCCSIIPPPVEF